jgi:protein transport protein SEC23
MDWSEAEERDGLRLSWNTWPSTRIEASKVIAPLGALYTPLKKLEALQLRPMEPVTCKSTSCKAVLNPFCQVEYVSKYWVCPFCLARNHLPPFYHDISQDNLPPELHETSTTVEYVLPTEIKPSFGPPVFLFVIDTCTIDTELQTVKDSLLQSLMLLPEDSWVGLITFGRNVHVHELGFMECPKSYVFKGDCKEDTVNLQKLEELLGLGKGGGASRYFLML